MAFSLKCGEKACLILLCIIELILSGTTFYLGNVRSVAYECIIIIFKQLLIKIHLRMAIQKSILYLSLYINLK